MCSKFKDYNGMDLLLVGTHTLLSIGNGNGALATRVSICNNTENRKTHPKTSIVSHSD